MNIRAIEQRQYKSKLSSDCIVKILGNGGYYSTQDNWKYFSLDQKYESMNNTCISNNTKCFVIDHFHHPRAKKYTILILMRYKNENDYMLMKNDPRFIQLIRGKFPEPKNYNI